MFNTIKLINLYRSRVDLGGEALEEDVTDDAVVGGPAGGGTGAASAAPAPLGRAPRRHRRRLGVLLPKFNPQF